LQVATVDLTFQESSNHVVNYLITWWLDVSTYVQGKVMEGELSDYEKFTIVHDKKSLITTNHGQEGSTK
jgi:hypothetical protein